MSAVIDLRCHAEINGATHIELKMRRLSCILLACFLATISMDAPVVAATRDKTKKNRSGVSNPANDIPIYTPGNSERENDVILDPLARAGSRKTENPLAEDAPFITPTPVTMPPKPSKATQAPAPTILFDHEDISGAQCTPSNPNGTVAVSVEGKGTFCATSPVCAGKIVGNCPGVQPGLNFTTTCTIVEGGVYGCRPLGKG